MPCTVPLFTVHNSYEVARGTLWTWSIKLFVFLTMVTFQALDIFKSQRARYTHSYLWKQFRRDRDGRYLKRGRARLFISLVLLDSLFSPSRAKRRVEKRRESEEETNREREWETEAVKDTDSLNRQTEKKVQMMQIPSGLQSGSCREYTQTVIIGPMQSK